MKDIILRTQKVKKPVFQKAMNFKQNPHKNRKRDFCLSVFYFTAITLSHGTGPGI